VKLNSNNLEDSSDYDSNQEDSVNEDLKPERVNDKTLVGLSFNNPTHAKIAMKKTLEGKGVQTHVHASSAKSEGAVDKPIKSALKSSNSQKTTPAEKLDESAESYHEYEETSYNENNQVVSIEGTVFNREVPKFIPADKRLGGPSTTYVNENRARLKSMKQIITTEAKKVDEFDRQGLQSDTLKVAHEDDSY